MRVSSSVGILAAAALAEAQGTISFGPAFSLGPTKSWIREATTTLVLPKVPEPHKDRLAIWPGMGTSSSSLIQALAVAFGDSEADRECGAKPGQWCTWASTLQEDQLGNQKVPANAGDKLTMAYIYNEESGEYDQTVAINGKVVSSLSTSSGHAEGWGTAVECQDDACVGNVDAHQYIDTTIILNEADPTFKDTLGLNLATHSGFDTSDGGKTWAVKTIDIGEATFNVGS